MNNNLNANSRAIAGNIIQQLETLRSNGLSNEEILDAIGLAKEPIRMKLVRNGLVSEDGLISIHLNPMERSLYRLFLNHPEGIMVSDMWQFYSELLEYYSKESIEDRERIADTIDELCDNKAAVFTIVSRIKRKVTDSIGPTAAKYAIIQRHKDGCYRIGKEQSILY